jgi:hypothetical protein
MPYNLEFSYHICPSLKVPEIFKLLQSSLILIACGNIKVLFNYISPLFNDPPLNTKVQSLGIFIVFVSKSKILSIINIVLIKSISSQSLKAFCVKIFLYVPSDCSTKFYGKVILIFP